MVKKKLEEEPMKIGKKRGRPAKPKEEKVKKVKEAKPLKIYYKLPPVPKGYRQATMQEAVQAKKVNYWGISKVDNKLLEGKEKVDKGALMVKIAGLRGKLNRLKREIDASKTNDEKTKLMSEFEPAKQELLKLNEKLQKANMSGGAKSEPKKEETFNDYTLKQLRNIAKMYNEYVLIENVDKATKAELIEELEKHLYIEAGELKLKEHTFEIIKKKKIVKKPEETIKIVSKPEVTIKNVSKPKESVDIGADLQRRIKEYQNKKQNKSTAPVGLVVFLVDNYSELTDDGLDVEQAINEIISDLYKHYSKKKVILSLNSQLGFLGSEIEEKPEETQEFYELFSDLIKKKATKILEESKK